ncbi:MAG: glycosyltransferase [Paracoccaceae bacterium]
MTKHKFDIIRLHILLGRKADGLDTFFINMSNEQSRLYLLSVLNIVSGLRDDQIDAKLRAIKILEIIDHKYNILDTLIFDHAFNQIDYTHLDKFLKSDEVYSIKSFWNLYFRTNRQAQVDSINGKPMRIFQFWDNNPPPDVANAMEQWKDLVGNENYQLFNEEEGRSIIECAVGSDGVQTYDTCWHAAMKSDLFRVVELYERGGVYIDSDMVPMNGALEYMSRWSKSHHFWLNVSQPQGSIYNGVLFAQPKSKIMESCVEEIIAMVSQNPLGNPVTTTGPGILRKCIHRAVRLGNKIDATTSGGFEMTSRFSGSYAPKYRNGSRSWQFALRQRNNSAH